MDLSNLKPAERSKFSRKRVGRGHGSGTGAHARLAQPSRRAVGSGFQLAVAQPLVAMDDGRCLRPLARLPRNEVLQQHAHAVAPACWNTVFMWASSSRLGGMSRMKVR